MTSKTHFNGWIDDMETTLGIYRTDIRLLTKYWGLLCTIYWQKNYEITITIETFWQL